MNDNQKTFSALVHLEQLRHIETNKGAELSYASVADMRLHSAREFSYRYLLNHLTTRAKRLIHDNALTEAVEQPQKLFVRATRICVMIAAILGALAVGHAVGESATLNIYWLITVLLGFNFLSILLWILGISFNLQGLRNGVVAQLACWLPYRNKDSDSIRALATRAWWETCLTGSIGKWRISTLTHQFWLAYLGAGLTFLILLMMAKQYDFIWGTTLLPDNSLPKLTQFLGTPVEMIGFRSPDTQQIASSRVGLALHDAETRSAWASFLLGMLLVYGLFPRIILLSISLFMLRLAESRYKLDLYLPYYITLRQQLMSHEFEARVIDADPQIAQERSTQMIKPTQSIAPANALVVGIELEESMQWPQAMKCNLNVIDQASFDAATSTIKQSNQPLIIGASLQRLPDRGVQRMIHELVTSTSQPVWLYLLRKDTTVSVNDARKLAWFRLAEACTIPAEHVIYQ